MPKLKQSFFNRKTELIARELLGKILVRKTGNTSLSGMIVETEAYVGPRDLACHASRGKTERTRVMFEAAGAWYIYMIYGCYYCLNIVTESRDYPAAVLIRALEPITGINLMKNNRRTDDVTNLTNGPGKLCQALSINKSLNNTSAVISGTRLYIKESDNKISAANIVKAKRIGVDYAGAWKNKLLRFYIKDNFFVSKK